MFVLCICGGCSIVFGYLYGVLILEQHWCRSNEFLQLFMFLNAFGALVVIHCIPFQIERGPVWSSSAGISIFHKIDKGLLECCHCWSRREITPTAQILLRFWVAWIEAETKRVKGYNTYGACERVQKPFYSLKCNF